MLRKMHRLKQSDVLRLGTGMHADGGGLYLRVDKHSGGRSWIFRYRRDGRLHDRGLGSVHTFSVAKARQMAQAYRADLWRGTEPARRREVRRSKPKPETKGITFA